jgi:hypothetical protein
MLRTLLLLTSVVAFTSVANELDAVRDPVGGARMVDKLVAASYSGWGMVAVVDTGEWLISIDDAESDILLDPLDVVGNFPEYPAHLVGDIDVVQDGDAVHVVVMDEFEDYYAAMLTIEDEQAADLAEQLDGFIRDEYEQATPVPVEDREILEAINDGGGSCTCTGKCSAACPSGKTPYCNCRGSGTCRCIMDAKR